MKKKKIRIIKNIINYKDSVFYKSYFVYRNKLQTEMFYNNTLRIYEKN